MLKIVKFPVSVAQDFDFCKVKSNEFNEFQLYGVRIGFLFVTFFRHYISFETRAMVTVVLADTAKT